MSEVRSAGDGLRFTVYGARRDERCTMYEGTSNVTSWGCGFSNTSDTRPVAIDGSRETELVVRMQQPGICNLGALGGSHVPVANWRRAARLHASLRDPFIKVRASVGSWQVMAGER